jgi:site-specific recombinase XerD
MSAAHPLRSRRPAAAEQTPATGATVPATGATVPATGATVPATGATVLTTQPHADRYGIPDLTAAWLSRYASHTRAAYVRDLADFLAWCQRERLDPATARPADIDRYRAGLEHPPPPPPPRTPPGPATVARRLSALSSWYRYLVANSDGAVGTNPVAGARRPSVDRDASATVGLTTEEVRAVLRAADAVLVARQRAVSRGATDHRTARQLAALRDRALVRLLADLGLRIGEALALDIAALGHNRGRRTLRYVGKGGRTRERPLTRYASATLDDYLAARAAAAGVRADQLAGPLLATTGRHGRAGRLTEPAAFRLVRRLARRAGLASAERLSPHSLRHAFATNARELGVPLEDVQDAMGHADARTTRRYDRGRYALERDPALPLGDLYAGVQPPPGTM